MVYDARWSPARLARGHHCNTLGIVRCCYELRLLGFLSNVLGGEQRIPLGRRDHLKHEIRLSLARSTGPSSGRSVTETNITGRRSDKHHNYHIVAGRRLIINEGVLDNDRAHQAFYQRNSALEADTPKEHEAELMHTTIIPIS